MCVLRMCGRVLECVLEGVRVGVSGCKGVERVL